MTTGDGKRRCGHLVSWRVVSADGHRIAGTFAFSVGAGIAPPTLVAGTGPAVVAGLARGLWRAGAGGAGAGG